MKDFNKTLFFNYEVGRSLDKDFVANLYSLFQRLNDIDFYDDCHMKIVSVIKVSNDTQIITYALYKSNEIKTNLTFRLKNSRYLVSFKTNKNDEIISISAPKFEQISDMIEMYLPDFLMLH